MDWPSEDVADTCATVGTYSSHTTLREWNKDISTVMRLGTAPSSKYQKQ